MSLHDAAIRILSAEVTRLEAADRSEVAEAFREAIDVLEQQNTSHPQHIAAHNHLVARIRQGLEKLRDVGNVRDFRHRREAFYFHVLMKISTLPNYSTAAQMKELAATAVIADDIGNRKFGRDKTRPWRGEQSRRRVNEAREAAKLTQS